MKKTIVNVLLVASIFCLVAFIAYRLIHPLRVEPRVELPKVLVNPPHILPAAPEQSSYCLTNPCKG